MPSGNASQPLLPPPPQRRFRFPGRKPLDYRQILTGILFVLKTGMAWDDSLLQPLELSCQGQRPQRRPRGPVQFQRDADEGELAAAIARHSSRLRFSMM